MQYNNCTRKLAGVNTIIKVASYDFPIFPQDGGGCIQLNMKLCSFSLVISYGELLLPVLICRIAKFLKFVLREQYC